MIEWTFIELDDTSSTQAVGRDLAAQGAPEGTTVVAKTQSEGKGRLGRRWISPPGGLYMTLILRPGRIPRPEAIPLASALAVMHGVISSTGVPARLRWPNDVMVGSRKLGGVIAEAQSHKGEVITVLVGVGVNCNAPVPRLQALGGQATSLAEELGRPVEISGIRQAILESFSRLYERLKAGEDLTPLWTKSVGTVGKHVTIKVKTHKTPFSYEAVGVAPDGGLIVADAGVETIVHAEDIEWLREGP